MKNISILGSTGSIGTQTLEVIRNNREEYSVSGMTAFSSLDLFEAQIKEFSPKLVAIGDQSNYSELKRRVGHKTEILTGNEGIIAVATMQEADTVVSAIVGIAGLLPTYNAVKSKKNIALANKETLVTAGRLIMEEAQRNGVSILPVDSEHSAIFQSIGANSHNAIQKLILTASGGPFRNKSKEELECVSIDDALKHPNWKMGKKITVDSATLMNKGLEVIEARWLFDIAPDRIEVCVHPQSIVHSAVEFIDGSIIAQLGLPDMMLPIQYALTYPERKATSGKRLNLFDVGILNFMKPDPDKFPCLRLAYDALRRDDSACVVLNGANEIAVSLFLEGRISYTDIPKLIGKTLEKHNTVIDLNIDKIFLLDQWSRETARSYATQLKEKGCFK